MLKTSKASLLKKICIVLGLSAAIFFIFHNIYYYNLTLGYDFGYRASYAEIVSKEWRLPTLAETGVAYNPPLFYLVSGLFIRLVSSITGQGFIFSVKIWVYFAALLSIFSLYLWFLIIKKIRPKNKLLPIACVAWVFSLPVFQKMMTMYTVEPFFLFMVSLLFWYLIVIFLPKPTIKKMAFLSILVSLNVLTRLSALIIPFTIFLGIIGLKLSRQINRKTAINFLIILLVVTTIASGWFYYVKRSKRIIYTPKASEKDMPLFSYGLVFYTEIPFKFMMTYPLRLPPPYYVRLIPIYYSTFWGDFWNVYIPRRFKISHEARQVDRYIWNSERIASLALQNRVNVVPTILIITGFSYYLYLAIKKILKRQKLNNLWLIHIIFYILSFLSWSGFLYFITFHPTWKGSNIKACYMLFNIPIFIYFGTVFLFDVIKKYKYIFIPILTWLIMAMGINLSWSLY